jgi:hypothetical protein
VERASFADPAFWLLDSPLERLFGWDTAQVLCSFSLSCHFQVRN